MQPGDKLYDLCSTLLIINSHCFQAEAPETVHKHLGNYVSEFRAEIQKHAKHK